MMRKVLALAIAVSSALLIAGVNAAEVASGAASPTATAPPAAALNAAAANIRPTGPPVLLELGKGTLFRLPRPAATVFVANPDVADVQVKSPSLIYISASKTKPGETVFYAVDDQDNVLVSAVIRVTYDLTRLRESIKQNLPGELISVSAIEDKLVLSGTVSTAAAAQRARALAAAIVGEAVDAGASSAASSSSSSGSSGGTTTPAAPAATQIIDQLVVATPNQVNLRVRIAQVKVDVLKELGITLGKTPGKFEFQTTNPNSDVSAFAPLANSAAENAFRLIQPLGSGQNLTAILNALTTNGFATVLAEPNLTAISGQPASFLVGGEIFIPSASVPTATAGATVASGTQPVTFGVRLDFTATVVDANHINLKLRPEVSALNFANATTISGSTVPGKDETVAETTVDLGSGDTFALAGLLQHNTNTSTSGVPFLMDIPYFGQLFRTNKFTRDDTELVIIVTPYIVRPVAPTMTVASPTDGFAPPHDFSKIVSGDLYRQGLPAAPHGPLGAGAQGVIGPGGFRLD